MRHALADEGLCRSADAECSPGGRPVGRHELDDNAHRVLAGVLKGLCGMVVLSGYPCALYDEELFKDWHRVEKEALADGARKRIEVLWFNDATQKKISLDIFGDLC